MRVKFRTNLGSRDAQALDLDHRLAQGDDGTFSADDVAESLIKSGIATDAAAKVAAAKPAAKPETPPEAKK